jgi:hypothetical protein
MTRMHDHYFDNTQLVNATSLIRVIEELDGRINDAEACVEDITGDIVSNIEEALNENPHLINDAVSNHDSGRNSINKRLHHLEALVATNQAHLEAALGGVQQILIDYMNGVGDTD